jgi:hypothetical protein
MANTLRVLIFLGIKSNYSILKDKYTKLRGVYLSKGAFFQPVIKNEGGVVGEKHKIFWLAKWLLYPKG